MKDKLKVLWSKVQPIAEKIYSKYPFAVGVALGYIFKPEIKLGLHAIAKLIKLI